MKLYLTNTLARVLNDLNDILKKSSSKDFDFKIEVEHNELTLRFNDIIYIELLGTEFQIYCNKNDNSLTIDLYYYDF